MKANAMSLSEQDREWVKAISANICNEAITKMTGRFIKLMAVAVTVCSSVVGILVKFF